MKVKITARVVNILAHSQSSIGTDRHLGTGTGEDFDLNRKEVNVIYKRSTISLQ